MNDLCAQQLYTCGGPAAILVVEVKSTSHLHNDAGRQVYNYLRASNLEVGLLLHFGPKPAFFTQICPNDRTSGDSESSRRGLAPQSKMKTNAPNERIHESSEG